MHSFYKQKRHIDPANNNICTCLFAGIVPFKQEMPTKEKKTKKSVICHLNILNKEDLETTVWTSC